MLNAKDDLHVRIVLTLGSNLRRGKMKLPGFLQTDNSSQNPDRSAIAEGNRSQNLGETSPPLLTDAPAARRPQPY